MEIRAAVVVLALSTAAVPAAGEIYRWVDEAGKVHFTGDLSQVPAGQRGTAGEASRAGRGSLQRVIESPPAAEEPARPSMRPSAVGPAAPAPEERVGGRTEAQWRAEVRKYRDAIARLEPRAEACASDRFRWAPGAGRRAYEEELREDEACRRVERDLETNRLWLQNLEEKAHRSGVPPGWLRD
jgi:hypothetical protein